MDNKEVIKLAEEISFRLLATKKHESFDWLVDKLNKFKNKKPNLKGRKIDYNDFGDANEY